MSFPERDINVGLIGFGNIGTGVVRYFQEGNGEPFNVHLKRVVVADPSKPRALEFSPLTTDASDIINDPSIDIMVELMGGIHPAKNFMFDAIDQRKSVVTGNKAVMAKYMKELFEAARCREVDFGFEASVAGSIPIIDIINNSRGQSITRLDAIINGTTNYILTAMEGELDFELALKQAQNLGYAEKDPTEDIEGIDSQNKLAVAAAWIWNAPPNVEVITREGITRITAEDIASARREGKIIKLLATAVREGNQVKLHVGPTRLPNYHQLASVRGVFNAVYYEGDWSGPQFMSGRGAGERPTTHAVIQDIVRAARNRRIGVADELPTLDSPITFVGSVM